MKKLLLALALFLAPSTASAQCTGVFQPNTLCGNLTGVANPPKQFTASGTVVGPGSSVINELAVFANIAGTQIKDATGISAPPGGPLTITPTNNTTNQGLNVIWGGSQTGSLTTDFHYNQIIINNDGLAVNSPGLYVAGLWTELDVTGTNAKGTGLLANRNYITLTTNSGIATGGDLVGGSNWCLATVPNGGTNTGAGAVGTCYASDNEAWLLSGAVDYQIVSGGEVDCNILTGASAKHRWCWSIVGNGNLQGAVTDAGLEFGSPAAAGEFQNLIFLDNIHGFAPLTSTGCVLCTDGSSDTIATGIDLSAYTITGNFLKGPNFSVSGIGAATALSLTGIAGFNLNISSVGTQLIAFNVNSVGIAAVGTSNVYPLVDGGAALGATTFRWAGVYANAYFVGGGNTAGVNCSGSPTSSFASSLGIVTHC